jgi:hypothetical protein
MNLRSLKGGSMTGYQDFVNRFGSGIFVTSKEITTRYSLQKALASLYVIPTFFRGIYYIPTSREHKGHFIENRQDYLTRLFDFRFGRKKWYWGLSTAARSYGLEWSATTILEIVTLERTQTIHLSDKILSWKKKKSYRSAKLAQFLGSLNINTIYIHKGNAESLSSVRIDDTLGPVSSRDQILKDIKKFSSKVREPSLKKIYQRILNELNSETRK